MIDLATHPQIKKGVLIMQRMIRQLWNDDTGALIAAEYLFVATILVIGIVVGLTSLREAVNNELVELGNAILSLSQGFTVDGSTGSGASVDGSATFDTFIPLQDPFNTPPAPNPIDALPGF